MQLQMNNRVDDLNRDWQERIENENLKWKSDLHASHNTSNKYLSFFFSSFFLGLLNIPGIWPIHLVCMLLIAKRLVCFFDGRGRERIIRRVSGQWSIISLHIYSHTLHFHFFLHSTISHFNQHSESTVPQLKFDESLKLLNWEKELMQLE